MGRGSSKAGGGMTGGGSSSRGTSIKSENDKIEPSKAEKAIYDIDSTTAFPSSATVVKHSEPLRQLDTALKEAPVGTTVAFNTAYRGAKGIEHEKWVYEKTSSTAWKSTVIKDGNARDNGSYRGIKLLQSMSDKKYNAFGDTGLTAAEQALLKKKKK